MTYAIRTGADLLQFGACDVRNSAGTADGSMAQLPDSSLPGATPDA